MTSFYGTLCKKQCEWLAASHSTASTYDSAASASWLTADKFKGSVKNST